MAELKLQGFDGMQFQIKTIKYSILHSNVNGGLVNEEVKGAYRGPSWLASVCPLKIRGIALRALLAVLAIYPLTAMELRRLQDRQTSKFRFANHFIQAVEWTKKI